MEHARGSACDAESELSFSQAGGVELVTNAAVTALGFECLSLDEPL